MGVSSGLTCHNMREEREVTSHNQVTRDRDQTVFK